MLFQEFKEKIEEFLISLFEDKDILLNTVKLKS